MARTFALTTEEREQLAGLLAGHRLAVREFEGAKREFEASDEDDADAADDPRVIRAVQSVRRARKALYEWGERHLGERELYDADGFKVAPALQLNDSDLEESMPNYYDAWVELETEPEFGDLDGEPEPSQVLELEYVAKHGHPKVNRAAKKALAKLATQAEGLASQLRELAA